MIKKKLNEIIEENQHNEDKIKFFKINTTKYNEWRYSQTGIKILFFIEIAILVFKIKT